MCDRIASETSPDCLHEIADLLGGGLGFRDLEIDMESLLSADHRRILDGDILGWIERVERGH